MNEPVSLLEQVRGLIERTYSFRSGLDDLGQFVVGNAGYRILYGGGEPLQTVESDGAGARTLVRELPGALRACIYYPDELIETLERHPPQHGLSDANVDPFSTLVEELDHLLLLVLRRRQRRTVSLFELELQANVTKYFVLMHFLAAGRRTVAPRERAWLRHHLFEKGTFVEVDPEVSARYREATRWCVKFVDAMPSSARGRLTTLRRFHRADAGAKLELIDALATAA